MNSIANAYAALAFILIAAAVFLLGILEGAIIAGFVGFLTMMAIAVAFARRAEVLIVEETIGHRLYRGKF